MRFFAPLLIMVACISTTARAAESFKMTPFSNVQCDATSSCPDGDHCCFYPNGQTAGCCPNGSTCNVAAGTCDYSDGSTKSAFSKKFNATRVTSGSCCEMINGICCPVGNSCGDSCVNNGCCD
mmetsp:Transcript_12719/g.18258  ORF Transcript_12719/g.18258 Transcript_12719/m.18258 type:complete len:123 (+) Transcript_12719:199-567(+)